MLETTGAADPYPLISSFGSRGNLSHLCHLEAVIATIDAHSTLRATRPTPRGILVTDTFTTPINFDAGRDIVHAPVELGANAVRDHKSRVVLMCRDVPELELRLLKAAIRETQLS